MAIYSSMLRLFRANEGSGNTLDDSTPNDLDGTADGTLVWVEDVDLGTVPDLEGTVQIDCGDVAGADGAALTIAGWVKFNNAIGTLEVVLSKWVGTQRSFQIHRAANGDLNFQYSSNGTTPTHTKTVAGGFNGLGPYHFNIKFDAGTVSVKLNNVAQTVTGAGTATEIFASTTAMYIGGISTGGGTTPLDGLVKDIVVWNKITSDAEDTKAFNGEFWDFGIDADLPIGMSLASGMWPIYSAVGGIEIGVGSLSTTQFMAPGGGGGGAASFDFGFSFSF